MAEAKKTKEEEMKETKKEIEEKTEVVKEKVEEKKEEKKAKKEIKVKDKAVANGVSLRISHKHSMSICRVIRGKSPEAAVARLEAVVAHKRVIPMEDREVAHKKGKGISGGRYPKNACLAIINLVKQVGANAAVNGIENPVIIIARADRASRPYRSGGRRAKRTHVYLEAVDKSKLIRAKK